MVIDTSAILAWLKEEPERSRIVAALEAHSVRQEIDVIVTPFDEPQVRLAAEAFERYRKAQGHPAQLNMGDCAVYALAKMLNEPLLFVGNDFAQTDVEPC